MEARVNTVGETETDALAAPEQGADVIAVTRYAVQNTL